MAQPTRPAPATPAPTQSEPVEVNLPAWLIAASIVLALALIFMIGFGFGQSWGAPQWGPFSAWLSSGLTLAAVVVALRGAALARREAARNQRSRLVDAEIARRRENLDALSDLWGALISMNVTFSYFIDYLAALPDADEDESDETRVADEPLRGEVEHRFEDFWTKWERTVGPPMFKALALLYGSPIYPLVDQLDQDIQRLMKITLPETFPSAWSGRKPDTYPTYAAWEHIIEERQHHLTLAHQRLSPATKDAEQALDRQMN